MSKDNINPNPKKRASRFKRPPPIPMHLTERDEQIITRCWEDKFLSTSDLHTLFFGALARCVHRLRILYSNHYLDRHFVPTAIPYRGATQARYTISTKGVSIVSLRLGQEQNYVALKRRQFNSRIQSPSFLLTFRHLQTINATRIDFEKAFLALDDWQLVGWIPERLLEDHFIISTEGQVRRTKIRADGYFQYHHSPTAKIYSAFVEVDLGTMSHQQIMAKVQRYLHYFQTELPLRKYGTQWFRVLFITTSSKRANQLWHTISKLTNSIFWLTSFDEIKKPAWLKRDIWLRVGREGRYPLVGE